MTSHAIWFLLFTILLLTQHVVAFEILVIVSMPLKSHYMAFRTLFHELAVRGHNVTVINNFPDKDPPPNLRFVNLGQEKRFSHTLESYENLDSTYWHLTNAYRHLTGSVFIKDDCESLFESENVKAHLAEDRHYDVIFVEQFMSDCGLAYAMTFYDAPIIGITSHTLLPFAYPRLGLPFDVAADAFYFSNAGQNPSLLQKVENAALQFVFNTVGRWFLQRNIYGAFDQFAPKHSLDIEKDVRSRMKMMFSYQHFSVTGARPLAPQLLEIGGIHIGVLKAVPEVNMKLFISIFMYYNISFE